jgi:glutamate-5-semialdehyde dehydrogenase
MNTEPLATLRRSSRALARLDAGQLDAALLRLADAVESRMPEVLAANAEDCRRLGADHPLHDRLLLNSGRLAGIAADLRAVAALPSPLGIVLEARTLPSGLRLERVGVPLGVVGVVYEARPNVTFDVFALAFKAGNAVALKGGTDAASSNIACVRLIQDVLATSAIDPQVVLLLPPGREAVGTLLNAIGAVDVVIPRGSRELIDRVRAEARVPVIETGAGVCHTYVDAAADPAMAARIVLNAKTRRPTVCNALDCLVVHEKRLPDLPAITAALGAAGVVIHADSASRQVLQGHYPEPLLRPAEPAHFGTEFLSLQLAVRTVASLDEALAHIAEYGSGHSEAIVTGDDAAAERFLREVDAAAVFANASTAFTDGAQFGLGAEIGISTQKLHARGPMGLRELTSYKWVLRGQGEIRP